MQPLLPTDPQRVGPYRLTRRLGSGGMGNVYLGHSRAGRSVAVKVVRPEIAGERGFRERFRREVGLAMRVGGFWTAAVVDADPDCATPWIASQYVEGPSLSLVVAERGRLDEQTVRFLGMGLAEALAAFHGTGLVHRDLKPSNILLAHDGPRVIDFGISKAMDGSTGLTTTGAVIGTPGFMSPEQAQGTPVGTASDIFSFGAVLAVAVTGCNPFGEGPLPSLLYRVVHDEPDLDEVPRAFRPLVAACLDKEPEIRPTARQLVDLLGLTPAGGGEGPPPGWPAPPRAKPLPAAEPLAHPLYDVETEPPNAQPPVPPTAAPPERAGSAPNPGPDPGPGPGPEGEFGQRHRPGEREEQAKTSGHFLVVPPPPFDPPPRVTTDRGSAQLRGRGAVAGAPGAAESAQEGRGGASLTVRSGGLATFLRRCLVWWLAAPLALLGLAVGYPGGSHAVAGSTYPGQGLRLGLLGAALLVLSGAVACRTTLRPGILQVDDQGLRISRVGEQLTVRWADVDGVTLRRMWRAGLSLRVALHGDSSTVVLSGAAPGNPLVTGSQGYEHRMVFRSRAEMTARAEELHAVLSRHTAAVSSTGVSPSSDGTRATAGARASR